MPVFNNILAGSSGQGDTGYDIEQSLRFEDGDTPYLSRTPGSSGNRKTWTWSGWIKRGDLSSLQVLFTQGFDVNNCTVTSIRTSGEIRFHHADSAVVVSEVITTQVFRDPAAWYHLVFKIDTTQATASDRVKIYVNGEEHPYSTATYPSLNMDTDVNTTYTSVFGKQVAATPYPFDGYLAEVHFIDGAALTPSSFGETDAATNQWIPASYSGSYGTNGFYLKFQDSASLGDDSSGNTNDFTVTNLVATDQMIDTPTNSFCTINPLSTLGASITIGEGNLYYLMADDREVRGTFAMLPETKWYWEYYNMAGPHSNYAMPGIADPIATTPIYHGDNNGVCYYAFNGKKYVGTVASAPYGASFTEDDIIGIALNLVDDEITYYKNGVSQGVITGIPTPTAGLWVPAITNPATSAGVFNFGQDSSFAGNATAQGNQDSNNVGDFYYEPPTDFLALCTSNLSAPAIALPTDHFSTNLWVADDASPRTFTGFGHQPDFVWVKHRGSASVNHTLVDTIRGGEEMLASNTTAAEDPGAHGKITSWNADGITVADGTSATYPKLYFNDLNPFGSGGGDYVCWSWKAGGTAVSNTDGTITSSVSANADAGFSIVSWTGNGTDGATVGHGLSEQPEILIVKNRDQSWSWRVRTPQCDNDSKVLTLNLDIALITLGGGTQAWDLSSNTASVFGLGDYGDVNNSADAMLAYCFHSVEGYSKVGSYVGNGLADGPFVSLPFNPAFVLTKCVSLGSTNWIMVDNQRPGHNVVDEFLAASGSNVEWTNNNRCDLLSNGFKLRTTSDANNGSHTYLYLAFAESPFKTSNAR